MNVMREILWEVVRFIFLGGCAVGGILAGKRIREHKNAKEQNTKENAE